MSVKQKLPEHGDSMVFFPWIDEGLERDGEQGRMRNIRNKAIK